MTTMLPKQAKTTEKKVKYVGTETYINAKTGEIEEFEVTNIEQRDFNFTKVWMHNVLADLDELGNKKIKTAIYVCENIDRDGYFLGTMKDVATKLEFSYMTVFTTFKILQDCNFMKKIYDGCYQINADHIHKGTHNHRMSIIKRYTSIEDDFNLSSKEADDNDDSTVE